MVKRLTRITEEEFVKKILVGERDFRNIEVRNFNLHPHTETLNYYLLHKSEWSHIHPNDIEKRLDGYSINLSGSRFICVKTGGLYISYVRAVGTNFEDVDFSEAHFWRGNFERSRFEKVNFERADISGVNFRKTKHKETNFEDANIGGANFEGADVRGTKNLELYCNFRWDWMGSEYLRTKITKEQFEALKSLGEDELISKLNAQYRIVK